MSEVMMPRGISLAIAHLAIVSTISKNSAPNSIETGSKTLKFAPTIERAMCGTMSPTQPTIPQKATLEAVSKVEAQMITKL